ncbi:hypothetical protein ABT255_42295 [Streptomyces mirabilis]
MTDGDEPTRYTVTDLAMHLAVESIRFRLGLLGQALGLNEPVETGR